jgi:hypothetical protein
MSSSEWLLALHRHQRGVLTPAGELRQLELQRDRAERSRDSTQVATIDRQIDALFAQARGRNQPAKAADFSPGVRKPIRPSLSESQQMGELLLRQTGRIR